MRAWGKIFLITLFFVSIASGLFFLDMFRSYEAETRVLVVSRSASVDAMEAADNLAALVGTLPFYGRIADEDILDDPLSGYPQAKKRAAWNDKVSAERMEKGSVISVRTAGDDPEEARELNRRVTKTLFEVSGLYYDLKNGIDVRAVDGPIAETVIRHPFAYVAASFGAALLVTAAFFAVLIALPNIFGRRDSFRETIAEERAGSEAYGIGDAVPYIDPRKFIPVRPSSLPYEEAYQEPQLPDVPEPSAKASAPDNLPIVDTFDLPVSDEPLPFSFEEEEPSEEPSVQLPFRGEHEVDEEAAKPVIMGGDEFHAHEAEERGEPTVEEYKRRLNELLGGGR